MDDSLSKIVIAFAGKIVKLADRLQNNQREFVVSKQISRSATSIGANYNEGIVAFSRKDFINKFKIALKEANETRYWLILLYNSNYINKEEFVNLSNECEVIIKILFTSIRTAYNNGKDKEKTKL